MHGTYREQTGFHSPLWAHNLLMVQKTAGTGGEKDAESWGGLECSPYDVLSGYSNTG